MQQLNNYKSKKKSKFVTHLNIGSHDSFTLQFIHSYSTYALSDTLFIGIITEGVKIIHINYARFIM